MGLGFGVEGLGFRVPFLLEGTLRVPTETGRLVGNCQGV